jgi:hypothetical protein
MWQKLNRLDVVSLEKARIQIINILQLVCAPPRCFSTSSKSRRLDWLHWDGKSTSFISNKFGKNGTITISLDVEKLILSINGQNNQREHLVLSGMTYPMAYGWMSIKLNTFKLDGSLFNDASSYELEGYLKPDAEINSEDQFSYDQLVMYYGNANHLFRKLMDIVDIHGSILIDPSNGNMVLVPTNAKNPEFGFSMGKKSFPEPYFFVGVPKKQAEKIDGKNNYSGIWDGANKEFVFMASDFLTQDPDQEFQRVMEFFTTNYSQLVQG